MKRNVIGLVAILGVGAVVTGAWATCPEKCGKSGKVEAATVSDDGRSDTTKTMPCSGKADKAPCGSHAQTVSTEAPCGTHGKATTVADKAPCGGKTATLASDKAPCGKSKGAPCGSHAALTSSKGEGDVSERVHTVLASMPGMTFKIGSETTSCCQSAAALAKKLDKPIEYVVGEETFKTEGEATAYLSSLLEKQVEEMASVQFAAGKKCYGCPKTAAAEAEKAGTKVTYRVGGVDFEDKEHAHQAAMLAKEKLGEVKMSYKVGKDTFCCDKMAGAKAKQTGEKMLYVVGEEETDCETDAKMLMAKAKLAALIAAATAVLAS